MTYYRGMDGEMQRVPERSLDQPDEPELTQAQLDEARDDLLETFVTHGKEWGEWSLADFIDLEIDDDSRGFAERLATVNGGLYAAGGATFTLALDKFYREIILRHLTEDQIRERAEEIDAVADSARGYDG